jgi:hypothetical protein
MIHLLVRQSSCVPSEAHEITVAGEQFLGMIAEAIIQSVHEIQAHGSRDQLKLRRPVHGLFLDVNFLLRELLSIM